MPKISFNSTDELTGGSNCLFFSSERNLPEYLKGGQRTVLGCQEMRRVLMVQGQNSQPVVDYIAVITSLAHRRKYY